MLLSRGTIAVTWHERNEVFLRGTGEASLIVFMRLAFFYIKAGKSEVKIVRQRLEFIFNLSSIFKHLVKPVRFLYEIAQNNCNGKIFRLGYYDKYTRFCTTFIIVPTPTVTKIR